MAVVLQAKDARDWSYRGEGAANLVLAYCGDSPDYIGKVLRLQKIPRDGSEYENGHPVLTLHECLMWKEVEGLLSAPTREIAEQMYVQHVMCPLLGSEHVDAGIHILVSREFLEAIESNVLGHRPSWRVDATKLNPVCNSVLLISDHSIFPRGPLKEEFCISVEIKPKCGFLPFSEFMAEGNAIKKSTTRFRMHQALKLHQGKISQISEYDPLDMFSGSKDRVHRAVKALFATPQNNFRVFLNGSLIFGGLGGGADRTSSSVSQLFEDALKCAILAEDGTRTKHFMELVTEAIYGSRLLDRLLEVQKLDKIDVEGAIHAYYNILSKPCMICEEMNDNKLAKRCHVLHSLSLEESLKIVRDYLIAATAKDLSIMISFRPREYRVRESPYGVIFLEPTNQTFDYKASFIDLDMKPLNKMEYYYELDQQILSCYVRTESDENGFATSSFKEASHSDQLCAVKDASRISVASGN